MGRRRRRQVFFILFSIFLRQLELPLFTLASSSSHANAQNAIAEGKGGGAESMMLRKTPLGSRPPSCEGRCRSSCGRRCEAVQVPVSPHDLLRLLSDKEKKDTLAAAGAGGRSGSNHGRGGVVLPSAYDDHSNYKPLGWRCKCLHS